MSTTETLPSDLRKLARRFKPGYTLEHTGGGHYRVRNGNNRFVKHAGKNITLSGTTHGGRGFTNMETQLRNAGVLKEPHVQTARARTPESERARITAARAVQEQRSRERQAASEILRKRLTAAVAPIGGLEQPGLLADLGHVGALIARQQGSEQLVTPDLAAANANRLSRGQGIDIRYQGIWTELADRLEKADDSIEQWFALVREARGLPLDSLVEVGKPVEGDWPFRVELLSIEAFMVDHDYQRPVSWPFVRAKAAQFDESLVGTIDVSERRRGAVFAILDGQTRFEMCRLVGKKTIWASIYSGLDIASEARFFLHKNKDRKVVHPFYTLRARVTAGDPTAIDLTKIVERNGYKLAITAPTPNLPKNISAIAAIEVAYGNKRADGTTALAPTMATLKRTTFGLDGGQNNVLIRGLSRIFAGNTDEVIDQKRLDSVLTNTLPTLLLARAREQGRHSGGNAEYALARILIGDYNRGLRSGAEKLREL